MKNTFKLVSTKLNAVGETVYTYINKDQEAAFSMHPTKAWSFVVENVKNVTNRELNKIVDKFVENAIGDPSGMIDRVSSLTIK